MIEVVHKPEQDLVTIDASGKLTAADYDLAIPEIEEAIRQADGPLNLVIDVIGLKGIELAALWKDLKFDVRHFSDFRRIAIVGGNRAQEFGAKASDAFTRAEVRYFGEDSSDHARRWAASG